MKASLRHKYAVLAIISFFAHSAQSAPAPQIGGTPGNPSDNNNDNDGDIPAPFILHIDPAVAVDTTRGTVESVGPLADDKISKIKIPFFSILDRPLILLDGEAEAVVWFKEPVDVTAMYVTGGPPITHRNPSPSSQRPWNAASCIALKTGQDVTRRRDDSVNQSLKPGDPPLSKQGVAGVACHANRLGPYLTP